MNIGSFGKCHTATELSLSNEGKTILLGNAIQALGFEFQGRKQLRGRSGLDHEFDGIGIRAGNMVLAVAGAEGLNKASSGEASLPSLSPRVRVEHWVRDALLKVYDVEAVLESQGVKVDLLFLNNAFTKYTIEDLIPGTDILDKHGLQAALSWQTSAGPVDLAPQNHVSDIAHSIGAGYFSINDLSIEELATLSKGATSASVSQAGEFLRRQRVLQYFSPPTDELILTALAINKRASKDIVQRVVEASGALGHPSAPNALMKDVDYRDPIATAIALQKHNLINYSATVEITPDGEKITHQIQKTAQESFVIKLLRALSLPEMAKAMIGSMKSPDPPVLQSRGV